MPKKTKRQKAKYNNLKQYKYALVFNTFGRSDVARMARSWSWETIYDRLAIAPPSRELYRVPKLQQDKAQTRQNYYRNFLEHQAYGWEKEDAFADRKRKRFENRLKSQKKPDDSIIRRFLYRNRADDWKDWSSSKSYIRFPGYIKQLAYEYNHDAGLPRNSRFGFAGMYYRYVEEWSEEETFGFISPQDSPIGYTKDSPWKSFKGYK